jgi:hypothetical protein
MKVFTAVLLLSAACLAQDKAAPANPLVAEARTRYNAVKNNILKAAESMPEESYSFSPTKEERPFLAVAAHVADAQTGTCAAVKGEQKKGDAGTKKTKAELLEALKASFDLCDAAFDSLTDASATAINNGRSGLGRMWGNIGHDMEQYAILAAYMRQKGVKPPSAQN